MLLGSEPERTGRGTWRAGGLVVLFALLTGCMIAPDTDRPAISGRWEVAMTDSCAKLAGFLAMADLFNINPAPGERDFRVDIEAEMAKRCPDDVKPETPAIAFDFPTLACTDLRAFVAMADAMGTMAMLPRDQREIADKLIDDLDAEIEKRCPALE